MHGPRDTAQFPVLSYARVIAYDPFNHGVFVQFPSLQGIAVSAKILIHGNADGARINQLPLPVIGTMGLVAVPYGDSRSAVWLGSYYNTPTNAVTTSNPTTENDSQTWYYTHASGAWSLLDYYGNTFTQFADGSSVAAAASGVTTGVAAPATYRFIVDQNGNQTQIPYANSDRNQYPFGPFWLSATHPSSGSATISPSGNIFVQAGMPQLPSISMLASGTVIISANQPGDQQQQQQSTQQGPILVLDFVKGDVFILGQQSHSIIHMDTNGNITITANQNIAVNATGAISIESNSPDGIALSSAGDIILQTNQHLDSVNQIINTFNAHLHSGVTSGQEDTGTTTIPLA